MDLKCYEHKHRERWYPPSYRDQVACERQEWIDAIGRGITHSLQAGDTGALKSWLKKLKTFRRQLQYPLRPAERNDLFALLWRAYCECALDDSVALQLCKHLVGLLDAHIETEDGKVVQYLHPGVEFDWRQLYADTARFRQPRCSEASGAGVQVHRAFLFRHTEVLISRVRRYFPKTVADELLVELEWQLKVPTVFAPLAQSTLCSFLPMFHVDADSTIHLLDVQSLVPRVFELWPLVENSQFWDTQWLSLLSRIAQADTLLHGHTIEWGQFTAPLFSHLVRILEIAVTDGRVPKRQAAAMPPVELVVTEERSKVLAKLIAYAIAPDARSEAEEGADELSGKGTDTLSRFRYLLRTLECYFHPYNTGWWSGTLAALLQETTIMFCGRIRREREIYELDADRAVPLPRRVSDAQKDAFIDAVLPTALLSLYSKSTRMVEMAMTVLARLAYINPARVLPRTLEMVQRGLESVTSPAHTPAAFDCLYLSVIPMLRYRGQSHDALYPETPSVEFNGPARLAELLQLTVPAVDANDPKKTFAVFRFVYAMLNVVTLADSSAADPGDADEYERSAKGCSIVLRDWGKLFLQQCLAWLDHQDKRGLEELSMMEHVWQRMMCAFFGQMSREVFLERFAQVMEYLRENVEATAVAKVMAMVWAGVLAFPEDALRAVMGAVRDAVVVRGADGTAHVNESVSDRELKKWSLVMAFAVLAPGEVVAPYVPEMTAVLKHALYHKENDVADTAASMLGSLIASVCSQKVVEQRSVRGVGADGGMADDHWRRWDEVTENEELGMQWKEPSREVMAVAVGLVEEVAGDAAATIQRLSATIGDLTSGERDELRRAVSALGSVAGGASLLFHLSGMTEEEAVEQLAACDDPPLPSSDREEPFVPVARLRVRVGDQPDSPARVWERRTEALRTLSALAEACLEHRPDDAQLLKAVCSALSDALLPDSSALAGDPIDRSALAKLHNQCKQRWSNPLSPSGDVPRALQIESIRVSHMSRLAMQAFRQPYSALTERVVQVLFRLSKNAYADVRRIAHKHLVTCFKVWPRAWKSIAYELMDELSSDRATKETLEGVIDTLSRRTVMRKITGNWRYLSRFLRNITRTHVHDEPTVQAKTYRLFLQFGAQFAPNPLQSPPPPPRGSIASALHGVVITEEQHAMFVSKHEEWTSSAKEHFSNAVQTLLDALNDDSLHWRYQVNAIIFLGFLTCKHYPLTPAVLRAFVRALSSPIAPLRKTACAAVTRAMDILKPQTEKRAFWTARKTKRPAMEPCSLPVDSRDEYEKMEKEGMFYDKLFDGFMEIEASGVDDPTHTKIEATRQLMAGQEDMRKECEQVLLEFCQDISAVTAVVTLMAQDHKLPDEGEGGGRARGGSGGRGMHHSAEELAEIHNVIRFSKGLRMRCGTLSRSDIFCISNAELFKNLLRPVDQSHAAGEGDGHAYALFDTMKKVIEQLVSADDQRDQAMAAEMIGALLRGSRHWPYDKQCEVKEFVEGVLAPIVAVSHKVSESSTLEWCTALRYATFWSDPRRFGWLLRMVFSQGLSDEEASVKQLKKLMFMRALVTESLWKLNRVSLESGRASILMELFENILPFSHSGLKQVREEVSHLLAKILYVCSTDGRSESPAASLRLVRFMTDPAAESVEADEDARKKYWTQLRETVTISLYWLTMCSASHPLTSIMESVMQFVFDAMQDPDYDTARNAKVCLALLAQTPLSHEKAYNTAAVAMEMLTHSNWHVRAASLPFLQILTFLNRYTFTVDEQKKIHGAVCAALRDVQPEVQQLAVGAIGSLLRGLDQSYVNVHVEKFKKMAAAKIAFRRKKDESDDEYAARKKRALSRRHGGVLGLAGILSLHPYDVPKWLVEVLMCVLSHGRDPNPIKASVTRTVQEFTRTHQDTWAENKYVWFTLEELEILEDAHAGPSYYA